MQTNIELKSKSGNVIDLLIIQNSDKPKLTVVDIPGGFIETKEKTAQNNSELIAFCEKMQINYVAIDFSNNGKHVDQPVNELRFSHRIKDLETVIDYVVSQFNSSIVLLGSSLGGLITLNTSNYSPNIKGVILNCAAVKAHLCIQAGIAPEEFQSWKEKNFAMVWGVPFTYDFYEDLELRDATKVIPAINKPILWFHGTADTTVPIEQAREAKSLNSKINLVEVLDGGHRFGDKMQPGEWERMVEEFILSVSDNK